MTGQELQQGENAKKRVLAGHPRARFLLIAALALLVVVAAILLFLPWYMRPIARVNRMLADFGLAPIPASRTELDMQLGETTYVRFSADPNTIARYVSHASDVGEPGRGGMPRIQVDSKRGRPSWFRPAMSPSGRNYVSVSGGKNQKYATVTFPTGDDDEQAIFILLSSRGAGLDRIISWLRSE